MTMPVTTLGQHRRDPSPARATSSDSSGLRLAIAALAVAGMITLFLPWLTNGTTNRGAYALAQALRMLGALSGVWERMLYDAIVALPVLAALVVVACLFGKRRSAAILVSIEAALLLTASLIALVQLGGRADFGPWISATTASLCLVGAAKLMRMKGRSHVTQS